MRLQSEAKQSKGNRSLLCTVQRKPSKELFDITKAEPWITTWGTYLARNEETPPPAEKCNFAQLLLAQGNSKSETVAQALLALCHARHRCLGDVELSCASALSFCNQVQPLVTQAAVGASSFYKMSDKRTGTVLKKCNKCKVDMNGDMLDAQGLCPHCRILTGEEQQKSQQGKRDSVAYNADEAMEEPAFSDFISCHRTGRRNAIHDLQGNATRLKLEKLAGTMDEISIAEGESKGEADASEKEPRMTPENQDGSPPL